MVRGEDSDSLPIDLVNKILSRLPAKSVSRFRCVSKQWRSMLLHPYFTELLLTRSSTRPSLLFAVQRKGKDWCFFTSPHPQNPCEKSSSSSLTLTADSHMKFTGDKKFLEICGHASVLIYIRKSSWTADDCTGICNPSIGEYESLPLPNWRVEMECDSWDNFLGFDPIEKEFKVLCITFPGLDKKEESDYILTIGAGKKLWRKIHCPLDHFPESEGICINGVLYYLAETNDYLPCIIVCFDVRSEEFKFIHRDFTGDEHRTKPINYKGKLGVVTLDNHARRSSFKLCMWVVKDVEKPESEWSKYAYTFRETQKVDDDYKISVVGVTAAGEIVLSTEDASKPFYLLYLNPESNTLQSFQIQGFGANHFDHHGRAKSRCVKVFVDYVEDLKSYAVAATSISPLDQKGTTSDKAQVEQDGRTFESISKFGSLRLLDDDDD